MSIFKIFNILFKISHRLKKDQINLDFLIKSHFYFLIDDSSIIEATCYLTVFDIWTRIKVRKNPLAIAFHLRQGIIEFRVHISKIDNGERSGFNKEYPHGNIEEIIQFGGSSHNRENKDQNQQEKCDIQ